MKFPQKLQNAAKSFDFTALLGGLEGIRTLDLSDANRTLSQLSYKPEYLISSEKYGFTHNLAKFNTYFQRIAGCDDDGENFIEACRSSYVDRQEQNLHNKESF